MQILGKETFPLHPDVEKHMSNWMNISNVLYDKNTTAQTVLNMLAYELKNNRRKYILNRLFMRYSKIKTAELQELFSMEMKEWNRKK